MVAIARHLAERACRGQSLCVHVTVVFFGVIYIVYTLMRDILHTHVLMPTHLRVCFEFNVAVMYCA